MANIKLTPKIKDFVDTQLERKERPDYTELVKAVARKYGVCISKSTISRRSKALKLKFRCGRKRIITSEKIPPHSRPLDGAGGFFLKGAEIENGLLSTINQLLETSTESLKARKVLKLAQQINATLLFAPLFDLRTPQDIVGYKGRGLFYLTGQKSLPEQGTIEQYLNFLKEQKLLPLIIKEVTKTCQEALIIRIDFAKQRFYLDAQGRTVWSNTEIPPYFSARLFKTKGYIKDFFESPSPQRPLILQTAPGYTFLPPEMFNFLHCFERAEDEPISRIVVMDKFGKTLSFWQNLNPPEKCYFIFPLSPWQYARLQGTRIVRDFRQYKIGPKREPMAIADAIVNIFNPQLSENITVRAAMVRRKEERLALVTNISSPQERYIRKIAELYFSRWPEEKFKTYYDLLEEAHQEMQGRSQSRAYLTSLLTGSYSQRPEDTFRLFLEHLHRHALNHFFPSEYEGEPFTSMSKKFYQKKGFLKIRQNYWEVILQPFVQKDLQKAAQIACQRFNQSGIKLPDQSSLRIYNAIKK